MFHRDGKTPDPAWVESETARLGQVLDAFVDEMKAALAKKVAEGRTGWDDPANREGFYNNLLAHAAGVPLAAGEEANVANFAMILWFLRHQAAKGAAVEARAAA